MTRFFLLFLCGLTALAQPQKVAEEWKNDPQLRGASIGYCVSEAATGKVLAQYNADLSLSAASTLKIFTTGAALAILGPDFTYKTTIACTGNFDKVSGVLTGDLLICGSGDPSLQSEFFSTADVCALWAEKLAALGIKEIRGSVVGHAGQWQRIVPDQWIWADISNYFGATPNGLSYRDNKFQIHLSSGVPGSAAQVLSVTPQYIQHSISVTASVQCEGNSDQAYVYGDPSSFERTVRGSIPPNRKKFTIEAALPDPALLCAETLFAALKKKGIFCSGKAVSVYGQNAEYNTLFFTHNSPPLKNLIIHTNQHSSNHYCESLLLTLGKGSHAAGLAAIRDYWKKKDLDIEALLLADGSGLARASTASARLQCQALALMYSDASFFSVMNQSLPAAGRQGSMRSIGKGTVLENNLRAKTGYIERVRAYCGYVKSRNHGDLVFSVIFNNYYCSPFEARKKIEQFLLELPEL